MPRRKKKRDDAIECEIEEIADGVIFRPLGHVDLIRAPSLRQELAEVQLRKPARLVIDLTNVPEMDSAVIATLVETLRVASRDSGMLVLCGLQERVIALFRIVRLDQSVFTFTETVDEAIALPNRRKFGRYHPQTLHCDRGTVLDISAGGLRLRTTKKLRGKVKLRLCNDQTDLAVEARVKRLRKVGDSEYEIGVEFRNLGVDAAKKLAAILARVRETLQRRRSDPDVTQQAA